LSFFMSHIETSYFSLRFSLFRSHIGYQIPAGVVQRKL
jgi:hypothetical protein